MFSWEKEASASWVNEHDFGFTSFGSMHHDVHVISSYNVHPYMMFVRLSVAEGFWLVGSQELLIAPTLTPIWRCGVLHLSGSPEADTHTPTHTQEPANQTVFPQLGSHKISTACVAVQCSYSVFNTMPSCVLNKAPSAADYVICSGALLCLTSCILIKAWLLWGITTFHCRNRFEPVAQITNTHAQRDRKLEVVLRLVIAARDCWGYNRCN